ncbi:MAG: rhodanese-like domain-containing protein [Bacteroidetes bacterium]|nr:rhodanese-like domain-containing protein [Bacteroidota bacterium]NCQ10895.1 rhodanese-like domain-containing protein [Bacteroidota bacterium]
MIQFIKELFGLGPKVDLSDLIHNGALIVDVRTKGEFKSAHVDRSINIPLDQLQKEIKKLRPKKDRPIITCCATGNRSRVAKSIIKSAGYTEVLNGGGWMKVQRLIP